MFKAQVLIDNLSFPIMELGCLEQKKDSISTQWDKYDLINFSFYSTRFPLASTRLVRLTKLPLPTFVSQVMLLIDLDKSLGVLGIKLP